MIQQEPKIKPEHPLSLLLLASTFIDEQSEKPPQVEPDLEEEEDEEEEDETDSNKLFACSNANCYKVYKNLGGLKYHIERGRCEKNPNNPYSCKVENCTKTYKNQNGLKYHLLHGHK